AERQEAREQERAEREAAPHAAALTNETVAVTRGSKGAWSAATYSASSRWTPGDRSPIETSCVVPYAIETSDPSTYRCRCPVFGVMFVVVCCTMRPPLRSIR